ncbi:MAG: hypothetical protein FJW86_09375 [Actinobacteria bacterium]|nr:hypothetical protein [Actinomycetota bacterium]
MGASVKPAISPKPLGIFLAGAAVSVLLGVYAHEHTPVANKLPYDFIWSGTIQMKASLATIAVLLAVVQVLLAMRLYGKLKWPKTMPPWLGDAHRLTGTLAFVVTLPVAYQCLWSLGFQSGSTRVFIHSIVGCIFYGAFVTKVLAVRLHGLPDWTLPVVGGLVFAALVVLFLTSSLWFFTSSDAPNPAF